MKRLLTAALAVLLTAAGAGAGTLERIAETGVLRIGVRADAAPLSFLREGAPSGYAVGVCDQVARRLAALLGRETLTVEHVVVTGENRFEALVEGRIDMLCGAASVTLARRAMVDFSIPIYVDGASVLMRKGETAAFPDLAGRRIGVLAGATTASNLRATLEAMSMEADVVEVTEHTQGLARLLGRDIDAYFADQSILMFLSASSGQANELAMADNVLTIEPQAIALPLGDGALRLAVDTALSHLYREGEIGRIFAQNFAPATMGDAMKALVLLAPIPD